MKYGWIGLVVVLFSACTVGGYDTGTGEYSLTRADFGVAHSNAACQVDYFITDDNDSLPISSPFVYSEVKKANASYRSVLYYNKVETAAHDTVAQLVSFSLVGVAHPVNIHSLSTDSTFTDPVYFQSAWLSHNRKYINVGLNLLTGKVDGKEGTQYLGLIEDTVRTTAGGAKCAELRLFHSQNHVPEYYTSRTYVSLPLSIYSSVLTSGDSIRIRINTYDDGWVTKAFAL